MTTVDLAALAEEFATRDRRERRLLRLLARTRLAAAGSEAVPAIEAELETPQLALYRAYLEELLFPEAAPIGEREGGSCGGRQVDR